jgi:hypothetical protein
VTTMFAGPFTPGTTHVSYSRWPLVRASYLLSAAAVVLALIVIAAGLRSRARAVQADRLDETA